MLSDYQRIVEAPYKQSVEATIKAQREQIERLRAALTECAADYISPPCSVPQGHQFVGDEFMRRMAVARAALDSNT